MPGGGGSPTRARRRLGAAGEEAAAAWYRGHGYEVVARNWRVAAGEIDLVVRRGDLHVFCEVKTRTSTSFGTPAEAVTPAKVARLRRLAAIWLASSANGRRRRIRFDVASVLVGATGDLEVEILEGVL